MLQGAVAVEKSEAKSVRPIPCADECKHKREVKLVMSELEKLREKVARLEGGISKGEMVYLEVILLHLIVTGYVYTGRHKLLWLHNYIQRSCMLVLCHVMI